MSIGKMLIHRCNIYKHDDEKRGNFTKKVPDAMIYENRRCRFIRKNSTNTEENGRVKVNTYYVLMLPKSIKVENGNIVCWVDKEGKEIYRFKVEEPYSPSGKYNRVSIEREGEV